MLTDRVNRKRENIFRKIRKVLKIEKIKTLKRLTKIVINSTKLYFIVLKMTKFTKLKNELNATTKLRILQQISKTFTNLFQYGNFYFIRKISIFTVEKAAVFVFSTKNSKTILKNDDVKTKRIYRR